MTSDPQELYVWVWLPGHTSPVVAGLLEAIGETYQFTYGTSYLDRPDAVALYLPELPLEKGRRRPPSGMRVAGCISDAAPDSWGRRVIETHLGGPGQEVGFLTYLLESGSDRIGALDFQASSSQYVNRWPAATLEDMVTAAERIDAGEPLPPALDAALLHGSSIGGARPKIALDDGNHQYIGKLSSHSDIYPVVKAEGVAMELARRVGLHVAPTRMDRVIGRDLLLVERFDRTAQGGRRMVVSAHTILGADSVGGSLASYYALAETIRFRFTEPDAALRELFSRIVFNICVSNTDDHSRNHAAFWDGKTLTLTPAYDITPQARTAGTATQAMEIGRNGFNSARLDGCVEVAVDYHLDKADAAEIVEHQVETIRAEWADVADTCRLTESERKGFWERLVLNPDIFES